jgi:hypothetical protein
VIVDRSAEIGLKARPQQVVFLRLCELLREILDVRLGVGDLLRQALDADLRLRLGLLVSLQPIGHPVDELRPLRRDGLLVVKPLDVAVGGLDVDAFRQQPEVDRALLHRFENLVPDVLRRHLNLRDIAWCRRYGARQSPPP